MKNGKYVLVVAPESYTMKKYRGRYCYEHHLVWWEKYGEINIGDVIHHINGDMHDNRIENLSKLSASEHAIFHGKKISDSSHDIHGTYSSYKKRKCRCESCKVFWIKYSIAQNKYRRNWRMKKRIAKLQTMPR